jgi:hypothetical protein
MESVNNLTSTIRRASIDDLPRLMRYVDTEWKAMHVLAKDGAFFKYEYQNGDALNFIISENPSGDINGMLGFIPASAETHCDVWTTMWKVSRGSGSPILGLQLLQYLKAQGHTNIMSLGIIKKLLRFIATWATQPERCSIIIYGTGAFRTSALRGCRRSRMAFCRLFSGAREYGYALWCGRMF